MFGSTCPTPAVKRVSCPPGMLLRYFVNFYDMEIIEEEAFLAWKEDITQEFPGKGKALFQVPGHLALPRQSSPLGPPVCSGRLTSPHPTLCLPPPQVNQWLTWLETAEEEESDDDAD